LDNQVYAMSRRSTKVPVLTQRRRVPAAAIRRFVDTVVRQFKPDRVILFGSYARGTPRPDSDVDIMVVMETPVEAEQSLLIRQAAPCDFGIDLLVMTPSTLRRRLELGDFFLKEVTEQGRILYESADR
jgi:predicted nucleotidyltransferase